MAKTAEQLRDEFDAISDLTREAYDAIYSRSSGRNFKGAGASLEEKYKIAKRDNNTEVLKSVEGEWSRRQAEYKRLQTQKNLLRKQLNAAEKEEKATKEKEAETKLASSGYNNALKTLSEAELNINNYGGETAYIEAYQQAKIAYDDAVAAGAKPKPLPPQRITVPTPEVKGKDGKGKDKDEQQAPQPVNITEFYNTLADPKNKQLLIDVQNDLIRNFGWKGKANGEWSLSFQEKLGEVAGTRDRLPEVLRGTDFRTFLAKPTIDLAKTGGAIPTGSVELSTPTEAANTVESVFQSELGRLPTKKEVREYSKLLMAEEKKFSSVVRPVKRIVNGVEVTQYVGGLERSQFLQDLVRKSPEYKQSKKAAMDLSIQDLQKTALANGLDINKNFGIDVVQGWAKRIQNGEDADIFKNLIRKTAAIGLPDNIAKIVDSGVDLDTIYAPYKKTMASILEIPQDTISLSDPTLRSAIGPDKAMTIYDFQRQLRKDPRWQYTDNAREDVSTAVLGVLRDFGFQG